MKHIHTWDCRGGVYGCHLVGEYPDEKKTAIFCAKHAGKLISLKEHWMRMARLKDELKDCYVSFARNANRCAVKALKAARNI